MGSFFFGTWQTAQVSHADARLSYQRVSSQLTGRGSQATRTRRGPNLKPKRRWPDACFASSAAGQNRSRCDAGPSPVTVSPSPTVTRTVVTTPSRTDPAAGLHMPVILMCLLPAGSLRQGPGSSPEANIPSPSPASPRLRLRATHWQQQPPMNLRPPAGGTPRRRHDRARWQSAPPASRSHLAGHGPAGRPGGMARAQTPT